jgi:hypothetical protein
VSIARIDIVGYLESLALCVVVHIPYLHHWNARVKVKKGRLVWRWHARSKDLDSTGELVPKGLDEFVGAFG